MKSWTFALPILASMACASCSLPLVGGGIAGAGVDSAWTRDAAKAYSGYRSPAVRLTRESIPSPNIQQSSSQMLDSFPRRTLIKQDSAGQFGEFTISFRRQHLLVSRSGAPLIDEHLPVAFYMHDLQVGRARLNGHDVLLFLTRSRATTGLYFVGLYRSSGERLWTTTLSSGELWDCRCSSERLTFLNPTDRLLVTLHQ